VEVLLDTWNIKGHEALNLKEAVPQLSFVAFQLMREKKQTATESELLSLLEEARDKLPHIHRYAKGTPHDFLKRVELRSSLLVEAGHQVEKGHIVPFYQFRHLTFQEYLAAIAVVEGHYPEYKQGNTVLTPIEPYLTAEEWKETIPMAAVLAKKQAEPLIEALVAKGNELRHKVEIGKEVVSREEWPREKLPSHVSRLVQCLVEEAEVSPETLSEALRIIAFFARGCRSDDEWKTLSRGPYGEDLLHHVWQLYAPMQWPHETWLRNTYAVLAVCQKPQAYWVNDHGKNEIKKLLSSKDKEDIGRGLLTCAGLIWYNKEDNINKIILETLPLAEIEQHLFQDDPALWVAASWAYGLLIKSRHETSLIPSVKVMDRLLSLAFNTKFEEKTATEFAIVCSAKFFQRIEWKPVLSDEQKQYVRKTVDDFIKTFNGAPFSPSILERFSLNRMSCEANLIVAFHAQNIWSEDELAKQMVNYCEIPFNRGHSMNEIFSMLKQMGDIGKKYIDKFRKKQRKKKPVINT
jgi:hypothetical protein